MSPERIAKLRGVIQRTTPLREADGAVVMVTTREEALSLLDAYERIERLEAEVDQARRDGIAWAVQRLREWANAHASTICAAAARGAARAIEQEADGE